MRLFERRGGADTTRSAAAPARCHLLKRVAISARTRPPRGLLLGRFVEIHAVIGAGRFAAHLHPFIASIIELINIH